MIDPQPRRLVVSGPVREALAAEVAAQVQPMLQPVQQLAAAMVVLANDICGQLMQHHGQQLQLQGDLALSSDRLARLEALLAHIALFHPPATIDTLHISFAGE